jgi:hypothetical protein
LAAIGTASKDNATVKAFLSAHRALGFILTLHWAR